MLSDDLSGPLDEGVKKFTVSLATALGRRHAVDLISTSEPTALPDVRYVPASRAFTSRALRAELRRRQPEVLVYATRRSATFFSLLRARLLRAYCPGAIVVLLALQTRQHPRWQRWIVRYLAPDLICAQSAANQDYLARLGCRVVVVPSGVDMDTFRPVDESTRHALRRRYSLRQDQPVVLHVGHLQEGRGIRVLADLAATGACQVVLVASSSMEPQAVLGEELSRSGVTVLTDYIPRIEQLYQLADCYVFPVSLTDHAIEVPLSVLEALACDLPVVAARFGGLEQLFPATDGGVAFAATREELVSKVLDACRSPRPATRQLVAPYSWEAIADAVLSAALSTRSSVTATPR